MTANFGSLKASHLRGISVLFCCMMQVITLPKEESIFSDVLHALIRTINIRALQNIVITLPGLISCNDLEAKNRGPVITLPYSPLFSS